MVRRADLLVTVDFQDVHFEQPILIAGGASGVDRIIQRVMLLVLDVQHVRRTAPAILCQIKHRLLHETDIGIQIEPQVRAAHRAAALFQHHRTQGIDILRILKIQQAICGNVLPVLAQYRVAGCLDLVFLFAFQVIGFHKCGCRLIRFGHRHKSFVHTQREQFDTRAVGTRSRAMSKCTKQRNSDRIQTEPHNTHGNLKC